MVTEFDKTERRGAFLIKRIFLLIFLIGMIYIDILLFAVLMMSRADGAFYICSSLLLFIGLTLVIVLNAGKILKGIKTDSQSFPVFNLLFSTNEIREIIKDENFKQMIFPENFKYLEYFKESENFFLIKNRFISKHALVQIFISRHRANSSATEYKRLHMTYFTGEVYEYELSPSMNDEERRYINNLFEKKYNIRPRVFKKLYKNPGEVRDRCRAIAEEIFRQSGERDRKSFLIKTMKGRFNIRERYYFE